MGCCCQKILGGQAWADRMGTQEWKSRVNLKSYVTCISSSPASNSSECGGNEAKWKKHLNECRLLRSRRVSHHIDGCALIVEHIAATAHCRTAPASYSALLNSSVVRILQYIASTCECRQVCSHGASHHVDGCALVAQHIAFALCSILLDVAGCTGMKRSRDGVAAATVQRAGPASGNARALQ